MTRSSALVLLLCCLGAPLRTEAAEPPAGFSTWSAQTFARAQRERRILVVMVSTSWCHWCHVMKRKTYADTRVKGLLARSFLPIYVDADARPDLAERFRNYRWPATAFLTPEAQPILALRGYRGPGDFLNILTDVQSRVRRGGPHPGFKNPNTQAARVSSTDDAVLGWLQRTLQTELDRHWDASHGGWGTGQKYPVPQPVAHGLLQQRWGTNRGSQAHERAIRTLQVMEPLIDRAWGGVYQYSVGGTWTQWHPEKIMSVSAGALWNYAEAFAQTQDRRWRRNALDVLRWFEGFVQDPAGGFYTSQDADAPGLAGETFYRLDANARARGGYGVPHVDKAIYARECGWAIQAYAHVIAHVADPSMATRLRTHVDKTIERVLREHQNADGTLRHGSKQTARTFLEDQTAFARGLLAMHALDPTGDRLAQAQRIVAGMRSQLADPAGGFFDVSGSTGPGVFSERGHSLEGNADAARLLLRLAVWTKDPALGSEARRTIMSVSDSARIRGHWRHVAGLLIAVETAVRPFAHIEVHGSGVSSRELWQTARALATAPHIVASRVLTSDKAFAVVCGHDTCSEQITDPTKLGQAVRAQEGAKALGSR